MSLGDDLAIVDGTEPAVVRLKRPNGSAEFSTDYAVRGDLTFALRAFAGLEITGGEVAWELPDVVPAGESLGTDDEVIVGTVTYAVVSAIRLPMDAGWRAICRPRRA